MKTKLVWFSESGEILAQSPEMETEDDAQTNTEDLLLIPNAAYVRVYVGPDSVLLINLER